MLIEPLLYIVFVFSALVLIVVILLQEGKGGGFGSALGEHGQQTFGVGAKGINTFTGYTAGVFLVSALLLHIVKPDSASESAIDFGESVIENIQAPNQGPGASGFPGGATGGATGAGGQGAGAGGATPPPSDNG